MKQIFTILLLSLGLSLSAQTYLEEGDKVNNLTLSTIEGDTINIEDLRGKVVYINFFATWCAPCMKELQMIHTGELKEVNNEDVYFITLGRGHTTEQLTKFKENKGFTFNIGCDTDKSKFLMFSEKGIPLNIVIDRDGEIVYKHNGFSDSSFKKLKRSIKRAL